MSYPFSIPFPYSRIVLVNPLISPSNIWHLPTPLMTVTFIWRDQQKTTFVDRFLAWSCNKSFLSFRRLSFDSYILTRNTCFTGIINKVLTHNCLGTSLVSAWIPSSLYFKQTPRYLILQVSYLFYHSSYRSPDWINKYLKVLLL